MAGLWAREWGKLVRMTKERGPAYNLGHLSSGGVVFKGCRQGIRLVLPAAGDFQTICEDLTRRLAESGGFFHGARMTLDQRSFPLPPGQFDKLAALLGEFGIELAPDESPAAAPDLPPEPAEIFRSHLRSGQHLAAGGNLIILGDVHPGAKASAGGDLIIFGRASGVLEAGLSRGRAAVIFAFQLRPALLRLGDLVARSPAFEPSWQAEVARARGGRIVVEPFLGWPRARSGRAKNKDWGEK